MKKILNLSLGILILNSNFHAQGGWTKLTSTTNPVFSPQVTGQYNGAAWVDIDNDNDIDLFVSPNKLFRNDGAGNFVMLDSLSFTAGVNAFGGIVAGSSWADINNDGFIDCIIAQHPSAVYINNGNATFTNSSAALSGLTNYASWACAIGSLDNDKFLDFVYVHAAGFHAGASVPSKLYISKNNSVSPIPLNGIALTDSTKPYTVPYWSDFDLDGDMDLFVASGPGGSAGYDYCYKNQTMETGKDSLSRMTSLLFSTQKQDGQCYNFIDYDNDGDLDLCLTNYSGSPSRLYNNVLGVYSQVNAPWTSGALPYLANCWGDYDNDGDLDMITTSDNFSARYYRNNGNGSFTYLTSGINTALGTSGATNGDYDNDGDLDIYLNGLKSAKALFRNDTVAANRKWVNLKLTGTLSNVSAIGAIVRIKATLNGSPVWQMREINAQNSFQSQNDLRVHFGLKDATVIDSLVIKWPSGVIQNFTFISSNTFYFIHETNGLTVKIDQYERNKEDLFLFPNPAKSEVNIVHPQLRGSLVCVYTTTGQLVYSAMLLSDKHSIKMSEFSSGSYIVVLKNKGETYSKKIIKE